MELLNAKVALSQVLLKPSLHLLYQNRLPLKHGYVYYRLCNYVRRYVSDPIRLRLIKSYLPSLYLYVTHVINYSRPSPAFSYCKRRNAGWGLETRLVTK